MAARKLWFAILSALIITAALSARIYRLPERYVFGADEEYQDTYARTIVKDFHPIWIGMNVGDTGAYHGPFHIYFTAFWLWLGSGDPLITAYAAAVMGAITTGSCIYIFSNLFGWRIGLATGALYALSPLMVFYDQKYWNPSPVPLLAIWLVYSFVRLPQKSAWILAIAAILGTIVNTHFSLFVLYPVAIYYLLKNRTYISLKLWLLSGLIFGLAILPLLIFDYYHDFSNILTPFRLIGTTSGPTYNFLGNLSLVGSAFARAIFLIPGKSNADEVLAACRAYATNHNHLISIFASLPFLLFLLNRKNWRGRYFPLLISITVILLGFIFYPRSVSEYYLLGLLPFYFLSVAFLLVHKLRLGLIIASVILFAVISINTLISVDERYGLEAKRSLINMIEIELGDKSYYLDETGTGCHKWEGWRYLFSVYGKPPASSSTDNYLGWLYPAEIMDGNQFQVTVGNTNMFDVPDQAASVYSSGAYTAILEKLD